ncbi:hypothetical protein IFM89_035876 [Coptis chinensis]|uniref:Uncharacterized protein n=1 Tax=Coptis chinensis TaxID=261450 RepID=A0A835LCM1_9MAGN|nr:hypothetical protein IFM89_035876 [Coptis chinensis]
MDDMLKLWFAIIQTTRSGCEDPNLDDPLVNPIKDPNFSKLATKRGGGVVELFESMGEVHVFHISKLISGKADEMMKKFERDGKKIKENLGRMGWAEYGAFGSNIERIGYKDFEAQSMFQSLGLQNWDVVVTLWSIKGKHTQE